jgi:predicted DNA-binding transcriptional regulator AlpA
MKKEAVQLDHCLPKRGLSRAEAAYYIGVGTSKFDEMVKDARMPAPKRIDGRVVWDRRQIDEAFELLPDGNEAGNPWDRVAS